MARRNYLIGLLIIGFWAVMTSLLLRREVLVPHAQPAPAGAQQPSQRPPQDSWMGIYTKNTKGGEDRVGYVHLTSTPGERAGGHGTRYGLAMRLETTMLAMPTELTLDGNAWIADGKGLQDFDFRVQSFGEHMMQAKGRVDKGKVTLDVETAGENFPLSFPVGQDMLVQGGFGATTLNMPSLEQGDVVLIDAFDPVTLTKGVARVECVGVDTIEFDGQQIATKVLETELSGVKTKTWVAMNDQVMRVETPVGLVLRRISQKEALRSVDSAAGAELIHTVAVRPKGEKVFRGAKQMRYTVGGVSAEFPVPIDENQRESGTDGYLNVTPDAPVDAVPEADKAAFKESLEGDPFIQAGNEKIVKLAKEIVGAETDPWRKSMLLYHWVYENIDKTPVLSMPSALDVLESKEGDCNEHSVLYAALARSVGVPTRISVGLVWSDELSGFYYHAWPEVYVGRWIPVDPTLGQPVADATHIKLAEGSVWQWTRLVPFLGQVTIDVQEIH